MNKAPHHLKDKQTRPRIIWKTNKQSESILGSSSVLGESRSLVQTLFYGLRKSRKNALPVATFPRCDITMSHVYLIRVLHYDTTRWIHLSWITLRMSCYTMLVIMYCASIQTHDMQQQRRKPHRLYLSRQELLPNPRDGTAWQQLWKSQEDQEKRLAK